VFALFVFMLGGLVMPAPAAAHGDPHPAHIHSGDCDAPGEVIAPLTNLEYPGGEGSLAWSETGVELSLDDILAEPHAIVVHESEENIGNYVLCGNIGGVVTDGVLTVALGQLNDSGMAGLAILSESDAGTDVSVFSIEDASVDGTAEDMGDDSHPAHIHTGDCDAPGEVVFPLTDVAAPEGEAMGAETSGVEQSYTALDENLQNITEAPHAIVAHLSADEIGTYLVCGEITGEPVDGTLAVQLNELGGSGYIGLALLVDTADGTDVWVFLMPGISGGMGDMGGASTPEMGDMDHGDMEDEGAGAEDMAGGEEVTATIEGFAFNPGTIEISAGTTVTWTNNDSAPHTVTAEGGAFQSGRLNQGDTFSFTFDEPGTYTYYCEFHPNMSGTVIVT
jgi:plastocyanin